MYRVIYRQKTKPFWPLRPNKLEDHLHLSSRRKLLSRTSNRKPHRLPPRLKMRLLGVSMQAWRRLLFEGS